VNHAVCVFCETTGATVKISKEHTFSNWINRVLSPAVVGPGLSIERSILHGPQAGTSNIWPVTKVASHEVRAVCKPCNEGWMSHLEVQVRPLIEPMILGYGASLAPDQQITVATWASLKAAVFEYAWGAEPVLTQAERAIIMTQNRPPASVQVRLAAVESRGYPLTARARGYVRAGTADIAYCLTLSIGCLVIQVFGGPGAGYHGFQVPGGSGPTYVGIYPPAMRAVRWPPARALDDATLQSFADPLRRGAAQIAT
jgi:hypothetical protein